MGPTGDSVNAPSSRVFLSYARSDEEAAARITEALVRAGFVVRSSREIELGEEIHGGVVREIETADALIVLLSPAAERSTWVAAETSLAVATAARDRSKRIYPVKVNRSAEVPVLLQDIKYIDLSDPSTFEHGVADLIEALKNQEQVPSAAMTQLVVSERLHEALEVQRAGQAMEQRYASKQREAFERTTRTVTLVTFALVGVALTATLVAAFWMYDDTVGAIATALVAVLTATLGFYFGRSSPHGR